jgi:hypothetical protein
MQTKAKVGKNADGFFKEAAAKDPLSDKRKADQKAVDTAVSSPFPRCSSPSLIRIFARISSGSFEHKYRGSVVCFLAHTVLRDVFTGRVREAP